MGDARCAGRSDGADLRVLQCHARLGPKKQHRFRSRVEQSRRNPVSRMAELVSRGAHAAGCCGPDGHSRVRASVQD